MLAQHAQSRGLHLWHHVKSDVIVHTCDPSRTQEGGRHRKIRSSSSSSYPLQSQPELHETSSPKDEKKLCPHETRFPIMWLSLGRNERASAHIRECMRAQMAYPGGSGSSVLLHPWSSMLANNPASRVSSLWPCKFWLLPKGNLSSFFHYKFRNC